MAQERLRAALIEAGLGDEMIRLICENKFIARAVVSSMQGQCERFLNAVQVKKSRKPLTLGAAATLNALQEAMVAMRKRGEKITQPALAKQMGINLRALIGRFNRHPELREAYHSALNGSV